MPAGASLNLACTALDVQGSLTLGSGQINLANNVTIAAGGTLSAGSGTVSVGGNWSNNGTFVPGTSTVSFVDNCTAAPATISGTTTFNNLTLNSTSGRTFNFAPGTVITVNGTLTVQGTPGNPINLVGPAGQSVQIRLGPGATVNVVNANVAPNVIIGNNTANTQSIPTLSEWALALLAGLLLLAAGMRTRRMP